MYDPQFLEKYHMFKLYYDQWKKQVTVFVPPHPYEQFRKQNEDAVDQGTPKNRKSERKTKFEKRARKPKEFNGNDGEKSREKFEKVETKEVNRDFVLEQYEEKLDEETPENFETVSKSKFEKRARKPRAFNRKHSKKLEKRFEEIETEELNYDLDHEQNEEEVDEETFDDDKTLGNSKMYKTKEVNYDSKRDSFGDEDKLRARDW